MTALLPQSPCCLRETLAIANTDHAFGDSDIVCTACKLIVGHRDHDYGDTVLYPSDRWRSAVTVKRRIA